MNRALRALVAWVRRPVAAFTIGSFAVPLLLWCLVSYVPFVWHPMVRVQSAGAVDYFQPGMLVARADFDREAAEARDAGKPMPSGEAANPVYLPAPHEVLGALHTAFTSAPEQRDGPWLHESLWHSIRIIFWGFVISSLIGLPLGIGAGAYPALGRLSEPFIEFFRYLPAPAFGALAVAVLGIYDSPKIAIIVIGTFFQQVLIIANTTRKLEATLVEAGRTLGARGWKLIRSVVLPGILPDLYRDQRILLGWAWTYLIVAELIGTSSGITFFITQQARYQHFDKVYAAIVIIGVIGFGSDLVLERLSRALFPWDRGGRKD
ncbi:ABC transporter permease [Piscinibacter terrae]|uniref:ABC transporter permease n=1 Tax=Piscinibacter terrae TaxID=2496871 RepID=A0A3N7HRT6_9BURK|nr:ABC transporter permease [Albitalea terrae]RQP24978.1 ABC transporter permease [Albitalea terrae]